MKTLLEMRNDVIRAIAQNDIENAKVLYKAHKKALCVYYGKGTVCHMLVWAFRDIGIDIERTK
jgi:hypothetical protein